MRSFTIHVNFLKVFQVSRKISAGWNDYHALGSICSDRRVWGSILIPETPEIWHFQGTK